MQTQEKTTSSSVKTPLNQVENSVDKDSNSLKQLDTIFQSVRERINQWGENAKWKIDLVLLDNPIQQQQLLQTDTQNNQLHPLLSPQRFHPNAITIPSDNSTNTSEEISITSNTQYPWDYTAPKRKFHTDEIDELRQKLYESLENQRYLENIIWSQAEQIKHSNGQDNDAAINTMKSVFLMSQNEQKIHHSVETDLLQKDIDTLSKKLKKMASTLEKIENINVENNDDILNNYKILSRKLYLKELRLAARDAEIDYLNQIIQHQHDTSTLHKKFKKGPPYLFQQQFTPTIKSNIRSIEHNNNPLSALDSLGIVADQMLSDPEFDHPTRSENNLLQKRLRSRLDDRKFDTSTPQLIVPPQRNQMRDSSSSPSPEQQKASASTTNIDHIPKKPRSTYTRWTEEEDRLLRQAVKKYGHSNWESCSREIKGRSNIQCRNRWIRHLEHKPVPPDEEAHNNNNASQSPSIAALLNTNTNFHYSPKATPKQLSQQESTDYLQPTYRPPSPIQTPENGKRRTPTNSSIYHP